MSSDRREDILGRIREALRIPAPRAHDGKHAGAAGSVPAGKVQAQARAWLPAVPPDGEGRLALFEKNCTQLRTDLRLVAGAKEAAETLASLRDAHHWTAAAAHHHPLLDRIVPALGIETLYAEQPTEPKSLERCSVGITACDALVAQTGSILLTSRSAGGRALSVLPPHHVVIAQADQLVPDLPAAFDLLYSRYGNSYPSFATFITGPSRTGDIERILVLGAHGPRNLTVILIR
ncbi:MAG: lactate utilization protein [Verrucomicrobia bacterium]|nr:lactate utilization protein [Verrucomicrobiota bacterium]